MVDISHLKGKWQIPLATALLAALALFAWIKFPASSGDSPFSVSGPKHPADKQVYLGPGHSLAILPFGGSPAAATASFLPGGFSSELYGLFIRAPGIRVTSQNSSFFFKDSNIPLRVIAERLQTAHLLSGEVQDTDGRLIVTARLYDAKNDRVTWSETYQRDTKEVFALQEEILAAVHAVIRPGSGDDLPQAEPVEIEAWMDYLQGLHFANQRNPDGYANAERAFRSALDVEPGYQKARIELAKLWLAETAAGAQDPERVENARRELLKVIEARPDLPGSYALLSYIRRNHDWDWQGALDAAERALSLNPRDPELMSIASLALFSLGQFEQAEKLLGEAVKQDPLNLLRRLRLGLLLEFGGEYDRALSVYRQIIGLNPEFPGARAYRARVKIIQENPDSAMRESEQEIDPFWKRYSRILALTAQQRHDEADPLVAQMIEEESHRAAYQVMEILAFRGEVDEAFDWFERAREQKDGGMRELLGNYFLNNLHQDPRWIEVLGLMGLPLDLDR